MVLDYHCSNQKTVYYFIRVAILYCLSQGLQENEVCVLYEYLRDLIKMMKDVHKGSFQTFPLIKQRGPTILRDYFNEPYFPTLTAEKVQSYNNLHHNIPFIEIQKQYLENSLVIINANHLTFGMFLHILNECLTSLFSR